MVPKDTEIRRRSYWNVVCTMYVVSIGDVTLSVFCEHRTKFVYYFPRMHNLILQPQLQADSDLVNKVIAVRGCSEPSHAPRRTRNTYKVLWLFRAMFNGDIEI